MPSIRCARCGYFRPELEGKCPVCERRRQSGESHTTLSFRNSQHHSTEESEGREYPNSVLGANFLRQLGEVSITGSGMEFTVDLELPWPTEVSQVSDLRIYFFADNQKSGYLIREGSPIDPNRWHPVSHSGTDSWQIGETLRFQIKLESPVNIGDHRISVSTAKHKTTYVYFTRNE